MNHKQQWQPLIKEIGGSLEGLFMAATCLAAIVGIVVFEIYFWLT